MTGRWGSHALSISCVASASGQVGPFTIPALLGNTASGVIGIEFGCKGPNFGLVSACASASHAMGESLHAIQVFLVHLDSKQPMPRGWGVGGIPLPARRE